MALAAAGVVKESMMTMKVLTEYEVGRAVWAAEIIAKTDKPITEVGARVCQVKDLQDDLAQVLKLASESAEVRIWTHPAKLAESADEIRWRYGFSKETWPYRALQFLDAIQLDDRDRAWINGLLFGYRPDAIQRHINRLTDRA
jgi:hypothetical protein